MIIEKEMKAQNGFAHLILSIVLIAGGIYLLFLRQPWLGIPMILMGTFWSFGLLIVDPNESKVLTLFGSYLGTIRQPGFFWANPFSIKKKVSLRAMNLNGHPLKVNDKLGNPVEIAAVVVWKVADTAKASFDVENYNNYVSVQSEAAVRHLAGSFPYDNLEDEDAEITLRGGAEKVNHLLMSELNEKLSMAGIEIIDARISHLAYASEIASAMLQRQQATAVVAARKQIVEGAVGMVEMALHKLSEKQIIALDEERKAAMVSNLLVVLCSDRSVNPVVNTGTLYN